MTPGYQTSEFWFGLGTLIATITGVIYGVLPRGPATWVVGSIVVSYIISRGILKKSYEETSDPNVGQPNGCNGKR